MVMSDVLSICLRLDAAEIILQAPRRRKSAQHWNAVRRLEDKPPYQRDPVSPVPRQLMVGRVVLNALECGAAA